MDSTKIQQHRSKPISQTKLINPPSATPQTRPAQVIRFGVEGMKMHPKDAYNLVKRAIAKAEAESQSLPPTSQGGLGLMEQDDPTSSGTAVPPEAPKPSGSGSSSGSSSSGSSGGTNTSGTASGTGDSGWGPSWDPSQGGANLPGGGGTDQPPRKDQPKPPESNSSWIWLAVIVVVVVLVASSSKKPLPKN